MIDFAEVHARLGSTRDLRILKSLALRATAAVGGLE